MFLLWNCYDRDAFFEESKVYELNVLVMLAWKCETWQEYETIQPYHKDFVHNLNLVTICIAIKLKRHFRSSHNFAYATTAALSRHALNCDFINPLQTKWNKIHFCRI